MKVLEQSEDQKLIVDSGKTKQTMRIENSSNRILVIRDNGEQREDKLFL